MYHNYVLCSSRQQQPVGSSGHSKFQQLLSPETINLLLSENEVKCVLLCRNFFKIISRIFLLFVIICKLHSSSNYQILNRSSDRNMAMDLTRGKSIVAGEVSMTFQYGSKQHRISCIRQTLSRYNSKLIHHHLHLKVHRGVTTNS